MVAPFSWVAPFPRLPPLRLFLSRRAFYLFFKLRTELTLYIVVGAKEQETRTLNIRNRDDPNTQKMGELIPLEKALARLTELRDSRGLENKIDMKE
jgi:hypothetical protein